MQNLKRLRTNSTRKLSKWVSQSFFFWLSIWQLRLDAKLIQQARTEMEDSTVFVLRFNQIPLNNM